MNTVPKIDTAAAQPANNIDPAEWETRVDLAAAYRLVDLYGMTDLHLNHISARVPGNEEHFLINPFGMMYEEITASSLIKVDLAGNIIANANPNYGINLPGYVIHSAIHGARHDVACVLHTHTNAGMAVSALKCGLLPLTQTAMRWPRIAYHDFEGVVVDLDEQKRLVENLGDCEVMILRNHGLLAVGQTIGQAFNNIYRLERACQTQLLAMACNAELAMPPAEVIARSNAQLTIMPSPDATRQTAPARLDGMARAQAHARPPRPVVQDLSQCLFDDASPFRPMLVRKSLAIVAAVIANTAAGAFDLQGHRGARGLAPENTLVGFAKALSVGVTTLEFDLAMTKDGVLVVHHDLWLNPNTTRDGKRRIPGRTRTGHSLADAR